MNEINKIKEKAERCNANKISTKALQKLISQCTKGDRNNKKINRIDGSKDCVKESNALVTEIASTLSLTVIKQLRNELAAVCELNSSSIYSIYESEVKMLNEKIDLMEYQNTINLVQLEEHAQQKELWINKTKTNEEQEKNCRNCKVKKKIRIKSKGMLKDYKRPM